MATVTAYQTKAGKRYRVRYRKPDKSQTDKRGFKTKKEAELFAATVTVSKATGEYIDPARGRVTVAQLAPDWLAAKKGTLKPSTYRAVEGSWRTHVEKEWGHREIQSLEPSEVRAWLGKLSEGKSATVVSRCRGILAGILDGAVDDLRIRKNPARGVPVKKKKGQRRVYLTHDQVHRLAAKTPHPTLILVLAYTGLRWGEATGLRVSSVNEVRRRLHVEENAVLSDGVIHVGTPKGHEKRSVPYPPFLKKRLAVLIEGKRPDALLFDDGGDYVRLPHAAHGWFTKAVKAIREKDAQFPRITPHGLRHTAASLAIASGATPKAVQRMLGHKSAAMTLDTYADLFEDDLDSVADRMAEAARKAGEGKPWAEEVSA